MGENHSFINIYLFMNEKHFRSGHIYSIPLMFIEPPTLKTVRMSTEGHQLTITSGVKV